MKKLLSILLATFAISAVAKENITVIYAFSASDTVANYSRVLVAEANRIQDKYNFVFDAKPGAGGAIAANAALNTPNTVLAHSTAFFVRPNFYPNESWEFSSFKEQFVHCQAPMVIASSRYKSWKDLGDRPATIGVSGLGVTSHIIAVKIQEQYPNLTIVPFKSTTDAMMSMAAGHTDLAVGFAGEAKKWTDSNKATVLGITGRQSHPGFPTLISQKFDPIFGQMVVGHQLLIPANWDDARAKELNTILNRAAKSPAVLETYKEDFCSPAHTEYKDLDKFYTFQIEYWKKLSTGIKIN